MKRAQMAAVFAAMSLGLWVEAVGRSFAQAYDTTSAIQPELGSTDEYLSANASNLPVSQRAIVIKDPRTFLTVEMGEDAAVSPVPGRARVPGPARFIAAPMKRTYVFNDRPPSQYAQPRRRSRRYREQLESAPIVVTGMGDDLAITPIPGFPPRY